MHKLSNVFGNPYQYKNISIYPVKMKNSDLFYKYVQCLLIDKNKSDEIEIIRMSYLHFILYLGSSNATDENGMSLSYFLIYFGELFKMIFQKEFDILFDNDIPYISILDDNGESAQINSTDFDNIKNIILLQNMIKQPSDISDPELAKSIREAEEFLNKKNDPATLEENIISYHVATGVGYEYIENLTIYQFYKGMERLNLLEDWKVYTYPALKGGEANKIRHWLSHTPDKGDYDHVLMNMDQLKNAVGEVCSFE